MYQINNWFHIKFRYEVIRHQNKAPLFPKQGDESDTDNLIQVQIGNNKFWNLWLNNPNIKSN